MLPRKLSSFLFIIFILSCYQTIAYNIIPKPWKVKYSKGQCQFDPTWKWSVTGDSISEIQKLYNQFQVWADSSATGFFKPLETFEPCPRLLKIQLVRKEKELGAEGYRIKIDKSEIAVEAQSLRGLYYGLQSLKQLSFQAFHDKKSLPCGVIKDVPRFSWRGMHLDVSRHFFTVREIECYLEILALHKMNVFHWHLTDDQGWRMEVKAYPRLTEIGSGREQTMIGHYYDKPRKFDGKPYGGFYTQKEIKHLVQFAASRMITVVPEIEMPGHCQEVIAAYPSLASQLDSVPKVLTVWGGSDHILSPFPATFVFLKKVLDETMAIFPSPYIHIGGDEAIKKHWRNSPKIQKMKDSLGLKTENQLQSWFIGQIDKYLVSKGRKMMGWDEILEGGLAPNAAVMSWRGEKGGIQAAKMKHNVVMTPGTHCYFDKYQHEPKTEEPLAIGGMITLEKVYSYNPQPNDLKPEEKAYILGAQGNVWTEYIPDFKQVQYMCLPRMAALSEVTWSKDETKYYPDFQKRVSLLSKMYGAFGWNFCRKDVMKL